MRTLLALMLLLPAAAQADTLVRHCQTLVAGSCTESVYVRPADAQTVLVLRSGIPWVAISSVADSERISVCVDDPTVVPGTYGPCTTRVAGRTDNWELKSNVYSAPTPQPPTDPTWTGSATLGWIPPTTNTDGSPLTNLAAYKVYWGSSADNLGQSARLDNPTQRSYAVSGLAAGTWYFAVTAIRNDGAESEYSDIVSLTLGPTQTCTAPKPADETRTQTCAAPAVGSWTQTRSYTSSPYPTCWTAGEWLPASAPSGACVVPEPTERWVVAPVSSGSRPVYEAVQNLDGNALVRGNREGSIAVEKPCGDEAFRSGRYSYRYVAESDVKLDSPTYRGREHTAICTLQE